MSTKYDSGLYNADDLIFRDRIDDEIRRVAQIPMPHPHQIPQTLPVRMHDSVKRIVFHIAGTEIRVRIEDRLLAERFGGQFREYQRSVPAYIPFIR